MNGVKLECGIWVYILSSRSLSDFLHCTHSAPLSVLRGSSQSLVSAESSLKMNFPFTVIGAAYPSGSYKLLTVDKQPLLVKAFSSDGTEAVRFEIPPQTQTSLRWQLKDQKKDPSSQYLQPCQHQRHSLPHCY